MNHIAADVDRQITPDCARLSLQRLGGSDHGTGYDHDCCGLTMAAITTLAMVMVLATVATIAG